MTILMKIFLSFFLQTYVDRQNDLRINVTEILSSMMRINQRSYITMIDIMKLDIIEKLVRIQFKDDEERKMMKGER